VWSAGQAAVPIKRGPVPTAGFAVVNRSKQTSLTDKAQAMSLASKARFITERNLASMRAEPGNVNDLLNGSFTTKSGAAEHQEP